MSTTKRSNIALKNLLFQEHAVNTHPMCFVLFGQTEVIVEEVTIDDSNKVIY